MKDLESVLKLLVVGLVAGAVLAIALAGRTAVQKHYEYQMFIAPRSIHQMTLEMEAADDNDRSGLMTLGAGLLAIVVLVFAGFIMAMNGGTELLRQWRLGRRKPRRAYVGEQALRIAPRAPNVPLLQEDNDPYENYANDY